MASIIWGGRTFSSPAQLSAWLHARGANYQTWAKNHPAAASKLGGLSLSPAQAAVTPPGQDPYQALIGNEPESQYDLGQITASDNASAAQRAAAAQALVTQYGAAPSSDPYGDITPDIASLAQENPYSTLAQIKRAADTASSGMIANRAARGVLSSGGTKLQSQDLGYKRGLSEYNATNALMEQLGGIDNQFAQTAASNANQLPDIYAQAMQRLIDAGIAPAQATSLASAAANAAAGGARQGAPNAQPRATGAGSPFNGDIGSRAVTPPAVPSFAGPRNDPGLAGPGASYTAPYNGPGIHAESMAPGGNASQFVPGPPNATDTALAKMGYGNRVPGTYAGLGASFMRVPSGLNPQQIAALIPRPTYAGAR